MTEQTDDEIERTYYNGMQMGRKLEREKIIELLDEYKGTPTSYGKDLRFKLWIIKQMEKTK